MQSDFDVANLPGSSFRAEVNQSLVALVTKSSGPTAPTPSFPNQEWQDETSGLLKRRNAANTDWVVIEPGAVIHAAVEDTTPDADHEVGIWNSITGVLAKFKVGLLAQLAVANLWTAQQRPKYLATATAAGGGSFAFDPTTHGQIALITLTTAGVVTMSAPTNIVEGAPYTLMLKAGDTNSRSFAFHAAYKLGGATNPFASATTVSGAYDMLNLIGGAANTLIYNGHKGDVR